MASPYWVLAPEVFLAFFAFGLLVLTFRIRVRRELFATVGTVGLVIGALLVVDQLLPPGFSVGNALGLYTTPVNSGATLAPLSLQVNSFSLFMGLTFLAAGVLISIASHAYIHRDEPHQGEYYALLCLSILGMMFVALATELFTLYLSFELATIATFGLTAFRKLDGKATEAAMKFFIVSVVSSALILFGISLLYGVSGQVKEQVSSAGGYLPAAPLTSFANLRLTTPAGNVGFQPTLILAILLLIAGFGFKVATVPFHMWAPDVYTGSPTTISAFLSTASKNMGFVALIKVFLLALVLVRVDWVVALGILAIVTQTVGNVGALPQKNVKRMLAYSSIGHAGYILSAVVVGSVVAAQGQPGTCTGTTCNLDIANFALTGGLYHMLVYVFMQAGAFLVVGITASLLIGENLEDFRGLSQKMPFVAGAMAIFLLSLAGLPPTGGFISKFVLFWSAVQASQIGGEGWMIALAISGVLNSALSLYYYARVIRYMYFLETPAGTARVPVPRAYTGAIGVALVAVLATFFAAIWFTPTISDAARSVFGT